MAGRLLVAGRRRVVGRVAVGEAFGAWVKRDPAIAEEALLARGEAIRHLRGALYFSKHVCR